MFFVVFFVCLFEFQLRLQSTLFQTFEDQRVSVQREFALCILICFCAFAFFSFGLNDLPLILLLFIAAAVYFAAPVSSRITDAIPLFAGATLGKAATTILVTREHERKSEVRIFLMGLVFMLAFASWWHVRVPGNFYTGPRWMGLWNHPNDYGMLMGVGLLIAVGLVAGRRLNEGRGHRWSSIALLIAAGIMAVGLVSSYSRGAWLGTVIGLLYLAKGYRVKTRRYLFPVLFVVTTVIWLCWNTVDSASWRIKRLDFSRGSVTHRLAAWRAGFQIMRDHPLGVGWDNAVETYRKAYSPPSPNAELAITTNDYLMLGTQLGWLALICFAGHVALGFGNRANQFLTLRFSRRSGGKEESAANYGENVVPSRFALDTTKVACRAGAIVLLVGFWFDGGLFRFATGPIFWILLALGNLHHPWKPTDASNGRT
ncbi:MAG TPA: O-antigen ligase family protein [Verrucomicrobiae bacterium]|nr:O-antigen ligase family protein [Verrucomicrobiae bacterium]